MGIQNRIIVSGVIKFDLENKTKKHKLQSSWKKTAFLLIDSDICEYYSWFINKRYNLTLNKPLRNAHISFINESNKELTNNGKISLNEANELWSKVKKKWDNKKFEIVLDVTPISNGQHWWLNVPNEERVQLQEIRNELGLGRPYYGIHMSLGYPNSKQIDHSNYIADMIRNGYEK
jgi:hypothetical protein